MAVRQLSTDYKRVYITIVLHKINDQYRKFYNFNFSNKLMSV